VVQLRTMGLKACQLLPSRRYMYSGYKKKLCYIFSRAETPGGRRRRPKAHATPSKVPNKHEREVRERGGLGCSLVACWRHRAVKKAKGPPM
jgi:hypothetical protein